MTDRLPPHSMESEESVLGCILEAPERSLDTMDERGVSEDWFYNPRHRLVYLTARALRHEGSAIDPVLLYEQLKGHKDMPDALLYLSSLRDKVHSAAALPSFLEVVEDRWRRRRLISACTVCVQSAFAQEKDVPGALTDLEAELMRLREPMAKRTELHIKEVIQLVIDDMEHYHRGRGQLRGLPTGLNYLDEKLIQGLRSDYYAVLAGRPGDGKTSLAMNIIEHLALNYTYGVPTGQKDENGDDVYEPRTGVPVGVFSLEMSEKSLGYRLVFGNAEVSEANFRQGFMSTDDFKKLTVAAGKLNRTNIYLDCEPRQTIGMIRAKARRWARQHGVKLFVLDYLQLVRVDGRRFNDKRVDELTEISGEIMSLKKELQVPWLVLCQMNRNIEQAESKRVPVLSDLKDCGAIEQDCDLAMFLYKPTKEMIGRERDGAKSDLDVIEEVTEGWEWARKPARVNLFVAKNRYGPTGPADLLFQKNLCRFSDWHVWKVKHGIEAKKEGERDRVLFADSPISDDAVPL